MTLILDQIRKYGLMTDTTKGENVWLVVIIEDQKKCAEENVRQRKKPASKHVARKQ